MKIFCFIIAAGSALARTEFLNSPRHLRTNEEFTLFLTGCDSPCTINLHKTAPEPYDLLSLSDNVVGDSFTFSIVSGFPSGTYFLALLNHESRESDETPDFEYTASDGDEGTFPLIPDNSNPTSTIISDLSVTDAEISSKDLESSSASWPLITQVYTTSSEPSPETTAYVTGTLAGTDLPPAEVEPSIARSEPSVGPSDVISQSSTTPPEPATGTTSPNDARFSSTEFESSLTTRMDVITRSFTRSSEPISVTSSPPGEVTSDSDDRESGGLNAGEMAGVIVGVVGGVLILLGALFFWLRRRKAKKDGHGKEDHVPEPRVLRDFDFSIEHVSVASTSSAQNLPNS